MSLSINLSCEMSISLNLFPVNPFFSIFLKSRKKQAELPLRLNYYTSCTDCLSFTFTGRIRYSSRKEGSSIARISICTLRFAFSRISWATVVSHGVISRAGMESSKPTTDKSWGTWMPRFWQPLIIPQARRSSVAMTAVGLSLIRLIVSATVSPPSC